MLGIRLFKGIATDPYRRKDSSVVSSMTCVATTGVLGTGIHPKSPATPHTHIFLEPGS